MDLVVREAILVEEQEHVLCPIDGWDLLLELDTAHMRLDRINDERAAEARQLSQLVVKISDVLVDLGMLPVQDIPQLLKSTPEALPAANLILKLLQEVLDSDAVPWD
jgi:hypothetical protein